MNKPPTHCATAPSSWIDVVQRQVERIRFGSVQIIVHEGRVTQVESVEKTRLAGGSAGRETGSEAARKNPDIS
ncbi:MAG: YezD family protein [Verrucomicrobiales bacterium]